MAVDDRASCVSIVAHLLGLGHHPIWKTLFAKHLGNQTPAKGIWADVSCQPYRIPLQRESPLKVLSRLNQQTVHKKG